MSLSSLGTMAISLVSMVFHRDPEPLEHYSYPKYTAAIKHSTWLEEIHFMLKEFYRGVEKMGQWEEDSVGKELTHDKGARYEIASSLHFIWAER